jgi:hypothetical protein
MFTLMNFIWSSFSVFMIYQAEAKRLRPFSAPSAIPRLHEPRKYPRYLGRPIQGCEPAARGGGQGLAFVAVTGRGDHKQLIDRPGLGDRVAAGGGPAV